ncbi:MAG: tetratricopeptide repeat protein [Burkholderiaceae bacterium]
MNGIRPATNKFYVAAFLTLVIGLPVQASSFFKNESVAQLSIDKKNAPTSQVEKPAYESPFAQLLRSARRLIEIRQYDLAYEALNERINFYAGDVEYDYLLGIAALENDRPSEAILALERVLINDPQHLQARAEIARAYLQVRENTTARREFEAVAAQNLPPEVDAVVARYIDALSRVKNQPDSRITYTIVLQSGYDNNVNIGSAQNSWLLSDGTQVLPLGQNRPRKSALLGVGGGIDIATPINGRLQWITGLHGMLHRYPSAHTLDQEQVDISTGLAYRKDCHQFKMLGQMQTLRVDGGSFRNAAGVVGQWQCDLSARQQLGGFAQRFELRFPDAQARDASRQSLGVSFAQKLPTSAIFLSTVHLGREYSRAGLDNLSFDFTGIRMLLSAPIFADWTGSLGFNWEERRFDGAEPLFGVTRHDWQTELTLGLESALDENWTLQPELVLTRNRSTLAPSDYRRTRAQLVARYRLQ